MSERDDLMRKLGSLAEGTARFGTRGRIISDGGLPSPVQALLAEIDETVLAQDITFHFGDAGTLVLIVSGHRILAVRSIEGLVMPAMAEQLIGKPISNTADATQRALVGLLMQIDLIGEPVETSSMSGPPFSAPPGTGLSAEKLAPLVGVTYPFTPPTRLDRFQAALGEAPLASLHISATGDRVHTGPSEVIDRLEALAGAMSLPTVWDEVEPKLSAIGQQSGQQPLIGALLWKSGAYLWTIEHQQVGAACHAFHKIFGS